LKPSLPTDWLIPAARDTKIVRAEVLANRPTVPEKREPKKGWRGVG
jgi:hypothetical protein